MKSKKFSIPQPFPDETLSSWMWRVNSTATIPLISHERFSSPEGEILERDEQGLRGEGFADRDVLSENRFIEPLMRIFGISPEWLSKRFPAFSQLSIPIQFRRAFCSECLMESFQHVGIPVSKVQWCYLAKPMCELHGVPLHDSTRLFIEHDDYSVQALVSYLDDPKFKETQDHVRSAGRLTHSLAFKAQQHFQRLVKRARKSGDELKVQMFMITLMRTMMMPAYHHAYPNVAFHNWGGTNPYMGLGIHADFFLEIYRSTCLARIHALYFSAIALGWISSKQAFTTTRECYFAPWRVDQVWSRLDSYPSVLRIVALELKNYQTQYLNLADLDSPALNRMSYDE
ncbi:MULTISPECIES: hypothetical protein [unclassified Pseudomonas]|uniref:hypothetical protein n=1 Tax=unclassified Pseudomonas TaxID=196821 RepID=UPI0006D48AB2|nr:MULTISPECIES: hypothetical protein [unclassified Pseudomonas]